MVTRVTNFYDLLSVGLGNISFQQFVDRFNEKYNVLQVEGFDWDPQIQLDYTYEQLIASLNIVTLPIYVDVDSEALDKCKDVARAYDSLSEVWRGISYSGYAQLPVGFAF